MNTLDTNDVMILSNMRKFKRTKFAFSSVVYMINWQLKVTDLQNLTNEPKFETE